MRHRLAVSLGGAVVAGCLAFASPALAMKTVCSAGCPSVSIQGAINSAAPGATITIAAGNYYENINVTKPVTLEGSGSSTVVYPGISKPECPGGEEEGSLCAGKASNIIAVEASKVTISDMSLNGNNPKLTSSVVREGQEIDARNGIIANYDAGSFNEMTVSKVSVSNIFLRGIYQGSEGTFNFNHDTVNNVQGGEDSIAMFNFGSSGVFSHNTVSNANDAISANWSRGTTFEDNKISKSGSGIHTDNDGGFLPVEERAAAADTIKGNQISACKEDGYGIFVFVPRVSAPTVESNKITGCYISLAAFGGEEVVGNEVTFANNKVSGAGASTSDPDGTYGAYLTTDQLGYAFGNLTATLTGNKFKDVSIGMFATQSNPTPGQEAGGQATITAHENQFKEAPTDAIGEPGTIVKAENNWWGCKTGPNTDNHCGKVEGTVSYTPWLTSK